MSYKVKLNVDCHITEVEGTLTSEEMSESEAMDMADKFSNFVGVEPEVIEA